jgi:lipoic acid synthetase
MTKNPKPRLPHWLRRPLPAGRNYDVTGNTLEDLSIQTICMHANCPNRGQCWTRGTATVLILGNVCTRNCKFCSVATGKPQPPDPTEPQRLAKMVEQMKLKYLVMTSVNRDDLPDKGASHFRDCILEVRRACPNTQFEILTPDFMGYEQEALEILKPALPFVFAHNVETVPDLYPVARQGGNYQGSLALLALAKKVLGPIQTKSSIMLGLGETDEQVINTLKDLRQVQCDRLTIGQYLKPDKHSLDVVEYITPEKFEWWQQTAHDQGIKWVISEPFARSSYFAEKE